MPRIEAITEKSQLPAEHHALYDRFVAARGRMAGPYSILMHSPGIADRVDALSSALRNDSALSPQELVLCALAVARAKDCLFVWSVQAPAARRAGVPDETIAAIGGNRLADLDSDSANLVQFAQQVVTRSRVDTGVFEALRSGHGERWLVDLTATAGHFALISGVNNAFEVPPAPEGDALPNASH